MFEGAKDRLLHDALGIGKKDLDAWNKQMAELGSANMPMPKPPKGGLPRHTPPQMAAWLEMSRQQAEWVKDVAHLDIATVTARAELIKRVGAGKANAGQLARELKKYFPEGYIKTEGGARLNVDSALARQLLERFGN